MFSGQIVLAQLNNERETLMSQDSPVTFSLSGSLVATLPKGENGYQSPAGHFKYDDSRDHPFALHKFTVIEGAPLSYNNLTDMDRLVQTMAAIYESLKRWNSSGVCGFSVAVGVKHGNPCGAGCSTDFSTGKECAIENMAMGDTRAMFGGVVMCNFSIDENLAGIMVSEGMKPGRKQLFDSVIASDFTQGAIEILSRKGDKCRLVKSPLPLDRLERDFGPKIRSVLGGVLVQPNYSLCLDFNNPDMKIFGKRDKKKEIDLLLASAVGSTSNSNTITITKDQMLIGNGVGQQDRVGAAQLAIKRAVDAGHKEKLQGAVAYSDSFFPFTDGVQVLIDAGIKCIFSTTGSRNDKEVQDLCLGNGVTLYQLPDSDARGFFGH